ncbi:HAD-IA family hydrolase [Motilimonas sp. 1_MG-2023]|uniref:HAD-IA family hydrolase n=1 Tax=Motilimonas sp. 1_MG-2023 TaxID=3062672 RepID=UPI0026E1BA5C|nr:HAD-IA family hydrolase [Motilimonas sp. 1_MG-2023]MDO6525996.1 HAD-IA family hydrolase [Motilimonas sp. 1_MG-2023]
MKCYRRLKPFKAISFDLDDTLYDNRPIIIKAEQQSFDYLRQQDPRLARLTKQQWFDYKQQVLALDAALVGDVTAWRLAALQAIFVELQVAEPAQMAQQVFEYFLHVRSDFTVPAASLDVLNRLAQVYPVIAITNGNVNLAQIGLDHAFSLVLKAGDGLRAKPYIDMFAYAANHLNIEIADILHVGDHLTTDVLGAKANGAQAIWFNDQGHQLRTHQDSRMLPDIEMTHLSQLLNLL